MKKLVILFFIFSLFGCKLKEHREPLPHSYVKYMIDGCIVYMMQDTTDTGKITKCTLWSSSVSCVVIGEIN